MMAERCRGVFVRTVAWSVALSVPLLGAGCDNSEEPSPSTDSLTPAAPDSFVTPAGRRYVKVKKAVFAPARETVEANAAQVAQETTGANGERTLSYPPSTPVDLRSLSVTELATQLRGRTLRDGYEYQEADLPMELAATVLKSLSSDAAAPSTAGSKPVAAAIDTAAATGSTDRYIIGSDDRTYQGSDRGWPNSTQLFSNGNGCSATLIGSRVAATAAHCVYNNGTWSTPSSLIPAADNGGNPSPYGAFSWSTISVPGGWTGSQWDLDYAVITFGTRVGDTTGWIGTLDTSSGTMRMVGYPGDKPTPQMWGKNGSVTSTSSGRRKHNLDIIPGDSGAGLYTQSGVQLTGIQSTQNWSQTCFLWICGSKSYWNEATRWNSTTYNFFASTGVWPD